MLLFFYRKRKILYIRICTNVIVFFRRRNTLQTCVLISLFFLQEEIVDKCANLIDFLQDEKDTLGFCTNVIVFLQEEKDTVGICTNVFVQEQKDIL